MLPPVLVPLVYPDSLIPILLQRLFQMEEPLADQSS
jgi:hypothetical protein